MIYAVIDTNVLVSALITHNPQAATSTAWKAIAADGTLVEPGTAGTLHWDWLSSKITLATSTTDTTDAGHDTEYKSMAIESGLTAPQIAKGYLLYPDDRPPATGQSCPPGIRRQQRQTRDQAPPWHCSDPPPSPLWSCRASERAVC